MPELNIASCDWNAYITLLRQQDVLWARHRDNISQSSYLRCLEDARAVLSLPSWDELSHREATILLGLGTQYGPHGLLGSLRGAGIVKATFMQTFQNTGICVSISVMPSWRPVKRRQLWTSSAVPRRR